MVVVSIPVSTVGGCMWVHEEGPVKKGRPLEPLVLTSRVLRESGQPGGVSVMEVTDVPGQDEGEKGPQVEEGVGLSVPGTSETPVDGG